MWANSNKELGHVLFHTDSDKRIVLWPSWCVAIPGTQTASFTCCVGGCWEGKCRHHAIQHVLYYAQLQGYIFLKKLKTWDCTVYSTIILHICPILQKSGA